MKKMYPYLLNPYMGDLNKYDFFKKIDSMVNQKCYVKITLLTMDERPLKEIQGELSSGSITKDGESSVRRVCSFSAIVSSGKYDIDDMNSDFSINKKVFLELGVENHTDRFLEYDILWFPQGSFFIDSCNVSASDGSAVSISISLKDKMCCLNGFVGGTVQAPTIFDEVDTQSPSGAYVSKKVKIYDIIMEAVSHFGNESESNIIIEDVPEQIRQMVRWQGDTPLHIYRQGDGSNYYVASINEIADSSLDLGPYHFGDDVGYIYTDFVFPRELTLNAGDSITTLLDTIKSQLGNYEYYYDEFSLFHFREKRNYIYTTQAKKLIDDLGTKDYLVSTSISKSSYTFSDNNNIISLSNSPNYGNIKNDFIVLGKRNDTGATVKYHVAIDEKPKPIGYDDHGAYYSILDVPFITYDEPLTGIRKGYFPKELTTLPSSGHIDAIYKVGDVFYYWDNDREYLPLSNVTVYEHYMTRDWRNELYVRGLQGLTNGTDTGDYFEELRTEWPMIYDLDNHAFKDNGDPYFTDINYYLDFIDPYESDMTEYSIKAIGRRTHITQDDSINCLFTPEPPNMVFVDKNSENVDEEIERLWNAAERPSKVPTDVYNCLGNGGYKSGAFDQIKIDLVNYTNYQKKVSITAIPALYLEPNTRVTISDKTTNTYGDYMVDSISMSFGAGQTMSVECTEIIEYL